MTEPEKLISMTDLPEAVSPDYLDDNLMIIDNVRMLGVPGGIRPNMNIIAICNKGKLHTTINEEPFEVRGPQVFICPAGTVIGELMVSPDFEYVALCITSRALQQFLRGHVNVWNEIVYVQRQRIFNMNDVDVRFYEKIYDLVRLCLEYPGEGSGKGTRREVLQAFLSAALIGLCNLLQRQVQTAMPLPRQNLSLFNRFLDLLQRQQMKHRPVEHYASQLCISAKYLTMVCKKNSGKTANQWITEYTLADITYELRNTARTVKEISIRLGFPNTSFFGKYVRDHLGCTPLEYRERRDTL